MQARLIYVMGASGSGKDSLLGYARRRLADRSDLAFAHRYITRPADAGGENHVALTASEFAARQQAGLFALAWESHGLSYGIGIEIHQWLAQGAAVVVNGSRAYLPEARHRFPALQPVWIEVCASVLRQRLLSRGRESTEAIEHRLRRHAAMLQSPQRDAVVTNNGPLAEGGEALVELIRAGLAQALCA